MFLNAPVLTGGCKPAFQLWVPPKRNKDRDYDAVVYN
jgi:hypothetical protein